MKPDLANAAALPMIADGLHRLTGGDYRVVGEEVVGPGTTSLVIAAHPDVPESERSAHVDIGFVLNRERDDSTIWDCSSGFGSTKPEALKSAVDAWLQTTAPVVLELLTQTGTYADHYSSAQSGLAGRHGIHGAILGWGKGDAPGHLQQWWLANPLLPVLGPVMGTHEWPVLGGLRIFFGSQGGESIAEVKINGRLLPQAVEMLLDQDWPRFEEPAYVRSFILTIPEVL